MFRTYPSDLFFTIISAISKAKFRFDAVSPNLGYLAMLFILHLESNARMHNMNKITNAATEGLKFGSFAGRDDANNAVSLMEISYMICDAV